MTDLSGRRNRTYGVNSQPTMGISDGRCTRSTLSMLLLLFYSSLSSPLRNAIDSSSSRQRPQNPEISTRRTAGRSAIYLTRMTTSIIPDSPTSSQKPPNPRCIQSQETIEPLKISKNNSKQVPGSDGQSPERES
uniref:Carbon catabolite repressor protein 4 homolog 1 n=1 Tax=Rhizophora mucronata TaxID=61149 RepID=A0A2P2M8Y3_RHIMU